MLSGHEQMSRKGGKMSHLVILIWDLGAGMDRKLPEQHIDLFLHGHNWRIPIGSLLCWMKGYPYNLYMLCADTKLNSHASRNCFCKIYLCFLSFPLGSLFLRTEHHTSWALNPK